MKSKNIQKMVFAALLGALTFAATLVSFPTPFGGNVNMGDGILLLTAWLSLEPWSIFACAIGASLTDLVGGYAIYAPATFVIKALMVLVAVLIKRGTKKMPRSVRALLSAVAAEAVMIFGYYIYEAAVLYGHAGALAGVPFNLVQGGAAVIIASLAWLLLSQIRLPAVLCEEPSLFVKIETRKQ